MSKRTKEEAENPNINPSFYKLIVLLSENPNTAYNLEKNMDITRPAIIKLSQKLEKNKIIYSKKSYQNKRLKKTYYLNYEKLASEFLKYLSKFIYNKQVYNLNNRLEKNILLHSLIKQYLKLSYSYNEINTLEGVFELMIEQMAFVNKNVLEGLDKSTKQLFKEIIEVKSKHKEMINNMIKNYKKGDDIK